MKIKYKKMLGIIFIVTFCLMILTNKTEAVEITDLYLSKQELSSGQNLQKNIILLYNTRLQELGVNTLADIAKLTSVKTIDLTGIRTGAIIEHEHIYETRHDESNHWQECWICGDKKDVYAHNLVTVGTDTCFTGATPLTKYCADGCGYEYQYPKKAHQWHDESWHDRFAHMHICRGESENPLGYERCYTADGQIIGCDSGVWGTCAKCGLHYNEGMHCFLATRSLNYNEIKVGDSRKPNIRASGEGYCPKCGKIFFTYTAYFEVVGEGSTRVTWDVKPIEGFVIILDDGSIRPGTCYGIPEDKRPIYSLLEKNYDGSTYHFVAQVDYTRNFDPVAVDLHIACDYRYNNSVWSNWVHMNIDNLGSWPDNYAPTFNSITSEGSGTVGNFSKKATVTATVTETWDNTVYMALYDSKGNVLSDWGAAQNNGDNTFTRKFDIVGEIRQPEALTVKAKDRCGNETSGRVIVQYIDSRAPQLVVDRVYNDQWSKEKVITFTATDQGVGNVQIGFNTKADIKPATKKGGNYSRTYRFIGDVYDDVTGALYLVDGLGNARTEKIVIGKLDSTKPVVTNVVQKNARGKSIKFSVESSDYNEQLGKEGSGAAGYAVTFTQEEPNQFETENNFVVKTGDNKYGYVWVIDKAGNVSNPMQIELIDTSEEIPIDKDDIDDKTDDYFCIEENVYIPSRADSTIKGVYVNKYEEGRQILHTETIWDNFKNPAYYKENELFSSEVQKRFPGYKSPTKPIYKISNEEVKAEYDVAYVLSYYNADRTNKEEIQKALYGTSLGGHTSSTPLSQEAKQFMEYRREVDKKGYVCEDLTGKVKAYYQLEDKYYLIGPFKVNYIRSMIKTNERGKVSFNGITEAMVYDENGKEINKERYSFYYDHTRNLKSGDEDYEYPYPNEEFYIKLDYSTPDISKITKIEFRLKEIKANAIYDKLEGKFSLIQWENKIGEEYNCYQRNYACSHGYNYGHTQRYWVNSGYEDAEGNYQDTSHWSSYWCSSGHYCGHSYNGVRYTTDHTGHRYYLEAVGIAGEEKAQDVIEFREANRWTEEHILTIKNIKTDNNTGGEDGDDTGDNGGKDETGEDPDDGEENIKLKMKFIGNVWNDQKETIANGIKEEGEKGIGKVKVRIYEKNSRTEVASTYTDNRGYYILKEIPPNLYDVEFEYDGQTYKTTKYLVGGSISDYKENFKASRYKNNSKVEETEKERKEYNNKFYEIGYPGAVSREGKIAGLEYQASTGKSVIQTLNSDGTVKELFAMRSRSSSNKIYYPLSKTYTIGGTKYIKIQDMKNINMGLAERIQVDGSLKMDVYESKYTIKGQSQSFIHSQKNIRDINSNIEIEEYVKKLNRADYNWRWQEYYDKFGEEFKEVWPSAEESELEGYIDDIIIIRNDQEDSILTIAELANYYDKDLSYSNDGYRDYEEGSWAVIKPENITEETNQNFEKHKIEWSQESKYGQNNEYPEYNKMYTTSLDDIDKFGIQKGYYLEVHIVYRIEKDENGRLLVDNEKEGKKTFAEINGYKGYNLDKGAEGLIDRDSRPANMNPNNRNSYEDDEARAPKYKLELDSELLDGTDGTEDDDKWIDEDGNIKGDIIGEDGKIKGSGNVIEGNAWEDLRVGLNTIKLDNNQIISDGFRQKDEPLINDIKVELIEIFENPNTGKRIEKTIKEQQTRRKISFRRLDITEGAYRFQNLASGKYKVKFTYGLYEQLAKNLKYNGQDYKSICTDDIYNNDGIKGNYEDIEINVTIDSSNSMSGGAIEETKKAAVKLIEKLRKELPKVKMGVVEFNSGANIVGELTNTRDLLAGVNNLFASGNTHMASGIRKTEENYSNGERTKKIMIILTDSYPTEESVEETIRALEEISDKGNVYPIAILTNNVEEVFGTKEQPRRGQVYQLSAEDVVNAVTEYITDEIIETSLQKEDRAYAEDVAGTTDEEGTRREQMYKYQILQYKNGKILDVEGIEKLEGEEREEAIREFAQETYMISYTPEVKVAPNNTEKQKIDQLNLALIERPKAELTLSEEITGIQVLLSDGNIIIDTEKGISKNVMGIENEELPISIYMDEEIMHGATIKVKYKINVENTGEIDRIANYIKYAKDDPNYLKSMQTITNSAATVYNYINKNIIFREENQVDKIWNRLGSIGDEYISSEVLDEIAGKNITVISTQGLNTPLYPKGSIEAEAGMPTETSATIALSKVISPQDDKDTLTYDNSLEIVQRLNSAGRRCYTAVPGNYIPNSEIIETDSAKARKIIVTKPLGGKQFSYMMALIGLIVLCGIIQAGRIKERRLHPKKKIYK